MRHNLLKNKSRGFAGFGQIGAARAKLKRFAGTRWDGSVGSVVAVIAVIAAVDGDGGGGVVVSVRLSVVFVDDGVVVLVVVGGGVVPTDARCHCQQALCSTALYVYEV